MGYMEGYGVREAKQAVWLKYGLAIGFLVILAAVALYFSLRDRTEKQKLQAFLTHLRNGDYKAAHALWGCTDATPCRDYALDRFLRDWGPASPQGDAANAKVSTGQHCSNGVIQVVRYPDKHEVQLWVERKAGTIGFNPWPIDTQPAPDLRTSLRRSMRDLMGDCSPAPMKVP